MRQSSDPIFIGIDPGVNGAVAVLRGGQVEFHDVPTRKATRGEAYLAGEMSDILRPYAEQAFCVLEEVALRQGESGRNGLKIGRGAGLWEGILAALRIGYTMPVSSAWKKSFGLVLPDLKDADRKKASRARACELFPAVRTELAKRRPDFAEALLLAEYGRRLRG